jgi:hypothetical protein
MPLPLTRHIDFATMADLIETDEDSGPESDLFPPTPGPGALPLVPTDYALRYGKASKARLKA